MLDKILYVNRNCVILYFSNRQPFTFETENETAMSLALELITPDYFARTSVDTSEIVVAQDAA